MAIVLKVRNAEVRNDRKGEREREQREKLRADGRHMWTMRQSAPQQPMAGKIFTPIDKLLLLLPLLRFSFVGRIYSHITLSFGARSTAFPIYHLQAFSGFRAVSARLFLQIIIHQVFTQPQPRLEV